MPITLSTNRIQIKGNDSFIPIGALSEVTSVTNYISPEYFGAVGDGIVDDTSAWQRAVNSGMNVVALSKHYKCGEISVTKNIVIDCNGADFNCTGALLFNIHGTIKATLTGQPNYDMNEVGYQITDNQYSDYSGFAMLQGTNNFDESRTYYYGGFVCTFHDGIMEGSYPVDVTNGTDNNTLLIVDPITATLKRIGSVTHPSGGYPYSIKVSYGFNCTIEDVNAVGMNSYMFIELYRCLNCQCRNIKLSGAYGTTGTNSYVIAFDDSSFCTVRDSYIYNKYWHCITTGNQYLCYRNKIENCVLLSDSGVACADHSNGVGTIVKDCNTASVLIGYQGIVENSIIVSQKTSNKACLVYIGTPTDERLVGATVKNVQFIPDQTCTTCGITVNSFPQESGKTFYVDSINIENVEIVSEDVNGKVWFGFGSETGGTKRWVVKNLKFNNCNIPIDLSCTNPYADLTNMVAKKAVYETV